ncbi:DUF1642 domain-containing protein [Enterococcus faecium]|uniref:DUF1642 domain-containing protein n=1 Tax=Enterococcus faecium TaxID=1352 RepID=UPI00032D9608|nr:DUF1642 domain-containing protein [Enterococcus faecium]EOG38588.1 hypothetical protein SMS_01172 [Enterococcus faecium EnGen0184]
MNKQELIDELAKYVKRYENVMDEHGQGRYGAYEVSLKLVKRLNESKITDEQAWNKVAEAYPESAQSLRNTLDNAVFGKTGEHQKPVVPKFVAEWIEYAKKKGDSLAISFKPWNLYGVEYSKADRWIEDNQETFARAWIDGYEVEKEPMYRVKLGEGYFVEYQGRGALIIPDDNKEIKIFDSKSDADRTAQTIGGAVEEVAEG